MGKNPKNLTGRLIRFDWFKVQIIFLILFIFVGISSIKAQDTIVRTKINLQLENTTIKNILKAIEKQTDYIFIYNEDVINSDFRRSISAKETSIDNVMHILFDKLDVDFKVDGRQVSILKKAKNIDKKSKPGEEIWKVTGVITSGSDNLPIPGVNVTEVGTTNGTITDIDGNYTFNASSANSSLKFSFIGHLTEQIEVNGQPTINLVLLEDIEQLSEVVVVGYGIQKKSDVTGSIAQVKSSQIENTASADIATSLQGKVSGVYIMNKGGQAGSGVDIRIRGVTSLNDVSPLWIIDGVPGDANTVNMNDVENIDIIKDGTAAAIYGVKAAAGVILVTTKRGLGQKKAKISFNTYSGISNAWRLPEMVNSDQYITLKNEQWATSGVPDGLSMDSIGKYPTTNWMKEMFRQGKVQNYDLNISGSTESSNYYIGGTYFKNEPSFIDNSIERFSFRINSDYKIAKWIKIGESLSFLNSNENPVADEGRYISSIFRTPPMLPVYDSNNQPGGFGFVDYENIGNYDGGNPMAGQLTDKTLNKYYKISGNVYSTLNIINGLTVTGTFAGKISFDDNKSVTLPYKLSESKNFPNTDINLGFGKNWSMLFNVYANYMKDFGLHNINLTAGYEASKYGDNNLNSNGINAKFGLLVLDQTDVTGRTTSGGESLGRSISQFGRFTYQYARKYVAQAVVRRDGSDKFGIQNRYGIFPSVSLAWKLSEENFIKNIPVISFLKLRGGYGINGNDNIGKFKYASYMSNSQAYPFGTFSNVIAYPGMIASKSMANPNITWERSKQFDAGLELGLFNNALFINIEPYLKSSDQMLFNQPLALSSGLADRFNYDPSQVINAGLITNRGVDISVTYKGNVGEFQYSIGGNFSTFNYTVDKLADNNPIWASEVLAASEKVSKTTVGQSSGYFFGYQSDGIFQSQAQVDEYNNRARTRAQELNPNLTPDMLASIYYNSANTSPGDLIYRDLNNDGKITLVDREKIGNPWPAATYGLQVTADFKGFDLMITSAGVYKRDVFNASKASTHQFASYDYSTTTMALSRWTPGNQSTTNYRIEGTDPNKNMSNPSSWYIEDASFFRIKNLELGYTIPKFWSNKVGISRFRVYASGQNIFTFTKYSGFDPEFGIGSAISSGVDNGSYPQSKVFTMGFQVEI